MGSISRLFIDNLGKDTHTHTGFLDKSNVKKPGACQHLAGTHLVKNCINVKKFEQFEHSILTIITALIIPYS